MQDKKLLQVERKLDGLSELEQLLLMIGEYMGWNGDISHVYTSDLSSLGDFRLEDAEVEELGDKLGFKVKHKDYLDKIAEKMKEDK
jgi:hypothetical protein